MTDSSPKVWTPPPPMAGPIPAGDIPAQPEFKVVPISWDAFDVPRMWDMLADEADLSSDCHLGWIQVEGFGQLSDLLWQQYRNLQRRCAEVRGAWQSPAGQVVATEMELFADSLLSDANCAGRTAGALHRILTAFGEGKVKMRALTAQWDRVTTDWKPEWWDHAAAELNVEARNVMIGIDAVVRGDRKNILIPRLTSGIYEPSRLIEETQPTRPEGPQSPHIPPVPGFDPLGGARLSEAELAGLPHVPPKVPAVPGTPVSMLPIPPGSPYAPYGGAYVLPGPGVGRRGYKVPMPSPTGVSRLGGPAGGFTPGRSGGSGMGMMPMPMGTPMPNGPGGGGGAAGLYRRPDTKWDTDKGVPPVIDGIDDDLVIPDQPSEKQEVAFKEWFADLAYPWRAEHGDEQAKVTFRKAAE